MRKIVLLAFGVFATACSSAEGPVDTSAAQSSEALGAERSHVAVCADASPGTARCHARARTDSNGQIETRDQLTPNATVSGFGPADLQSAYNLPSATAGAGQVIGIVDAFGYPNAETDLATYRTQFGLPPCTTANGCFRKVNQTGGTSFPRTDSGWSEEQALDVDMASAICPNCKILLVQASSASFSDLAAAVNEAAALGATVISNSYGGGESSSGLTFESAYNHPGIPVTVSSGDSGFGVEFPASSRFVTAVGGTHLVRSSTTRGWTETVWSGAGSGCSGLIPKPSWQTDTGCANRTVADVSAVADPNTGVAVRWTSKASGGWLVFGGTSVAAPIIAAVYALAGNGAAPSFPYAHASSFNDVTSGSNGSCSGSYLCTGTAGFDGPTGLGTPNGTGGF